MSWIGEILIKRRSNNSTVVLLETLDFKRIDQLIEVLNRKKIEELFGKYSIIKYDLQRQQMKTLRTADGIMISPQDEIRYPSKEATLDDLDKIIRTEKTMLIISYVLNEAHANMLSDYLLSWCQDDEIYGMESTIFVFTSGESLFNENLRKFLITYPIIPSTYQERKSLLRGLAKQLVEEYKRERGEKLRLIITEEVLVASSGLNLHEVETASLESVIKYRQFNPKIYTEYKISLLKKYDIDYIEPKRGFESVGGYDFLKDYVKKRIIKLIKRPDIARKYGLTPPRGIILYGYYGCGKSWFSRAMAKEVGLPMIKIDASTFLRGIVGETEARVKQVLRVIESMSPAIVFIDEIDQLAISRNRMFMGDSGVTRRMQNMLLDWLGNEDRKSILIGATNFIEQMDKAFIRTGRIDEIILILPPDLKAREEILKIHCRTVKKRPVSRNINFRELAEKTYMWTGAELEKLVIEASFLACEYGDEQIRQDHFLEAIKYFEINVKEREDIIKRMIEQAKRLEFINRRFLKESLKTFQKIEGERAKGIFKGLEVVDTFIKGA